MKTKHIFFSVFFCAITTVSFAQSAVEKAFVSMPNEFYLSMGNENRANLIEDYKNDSTSKRKNRFMGTSHILQLSPENNFMAIQNSQSGKVELKVLEKNDTAKFYALIFTVCGPICDSHVGFYGSGWNLLEKSLMPSPNIKDYLDLAKINADKENTDSIAKKFDITFIQSSFLNQSSDIECTLNSWKFLDEKNFERIKKYLKGDKILYKWNNGFYRKGDCYWEPSKN